MSRRIIIKRVEPKQKDYSNALSIRLYKNQYDKIMQIVNDSNRTVSEVFRAVLADVLEDIVVE